MVGEEEKERETEEERREEKTRKEKRRRSGKKERRKKGMKEGERKNKRLILAFYLVQNILLTYNHYKIR